MNEKSIDQIEEEVLICEISDEAVEAAGTRTEIAGVWTFVCTSKHCSHLFALQAMKSPGRGDRGFKDGRVGVSGDAFRPIKI
jgi:hypothetical protein